MLDRSFRAAVALTATLCIESAGVHAQDLSKYPDWRGAWVRINVPGIPPPASFDQTKRSGFGQQAPLIPEYQKILADSIKDQLEGGQGLYFNHAARCMTGGMPQMTHAFLPIEFVVTPYTSYVMVEHEASFRRIYTDGRDWRNDILPSYAGYSIGKWIDVDGDGKYDVLEVETRGPFKGPRVYDSDGLPLHFDNQSIFKERIYQDKVNPNILHDEITVIDSALTRPWTVDKRYVRNPNDQQPRWDEFNCPEVNQLVPIGKELYTTSADGYLMPVKKNQPPPDLRYFKQAGQ
jgi:hypothetical protein